MSNNGDNSEGVEGEELVDRHHTSTFGVEQPTDGDDYVNESGREAPREAPSSPVPPPQQQPQQQGMLVTGYHTTSIDNEEEEPCGICLEFRGKGRMVELCCCRNTMCVKDAQLVGVCPFCREEPLVWDFKTV